jgi:hypothetical protein
MLIRAILGLRWAILLAIVILGGHLWWAIAQCDGSYLQSGGAALIILGIIVASHPYWRQGFHDLVERQNPVRITGAFFGSNNDDAQRFERRKAADPQATKEVFEERYFAVVIIVLGTAINGYGALILRSLGYVSK